jgi:hypothetical protein
MVSKTAIVRALLAFAGSVRSFAQSEPSEFFAAWEDRVRDTLAQQPAWRRSLEHRGPVPCRQVVLAGD